MIIFPEHFLQLSFPRCAQTSLVSLYNLFASFAAAATCWLFIWLSLLSGFLNLVSIRVEPGVPFPAPGESLLSPLDFSPAQGKKGF